MSVLENEQEEETVRKNLVLKSLPGNVDSESGCQRAAPGKRKA